MEGAFLVIVVVVVVVGLVAGIWASATSGEAYRQIGRGGLSLEETPPPPATGAQQLEAEVRDLVTARNARRARAGKAPLDVEAEVAKALARLADDR